MRIGKYTLKPIVVAAAAAFAVMAGPVSMDRFMDDGSWLSTAAAQEGSGGKGAINKGGHHGTQPADKGGPKWQPGSQPWPEGKGPPADSDYWNRDGRPPRYGGDPANMRKPESGTQGGAPAWASQELVDIGRMNVARAPTSVLLRSEASAITELVAALAADPAAANFYTAVLAVLKDATIIDKVAAISAILRDPTYVRVDSPLANLAFYQDILSGDYKVTYVDPVTNATVTLFDGTNLVDRELLAAIFLGSASDKTKTVLTETVHAVDIIMALEAPTPIGTTPVNLDADQDLRVAVPAESVRSAIQLVHDE
jgi:hypothetical protein